MPNWSDVLLILYAGILLSLSLFGLHRLHLSYLFVKTRKKRVPCADKPLFLPKVTIQLPLYNERYVAERLIRAVALMDYPKELLEIQVLDDSTDDTREICVSVVAALRKEGLNIECLHRTNRSGFKAGALAEGLKRASGEFVAIFDADFIPPTDFLNRTMPEFVEEKVGMVQARWTYLNRDCSLLSQAEAVLLDGHFVVEHAARYASGRFFNFNGTAGIWRRQAIQDGGGWQGDTLTEDLDLSYRVQLKGWRFVYLDTLTAPSELPADMASFKSQQFRWAKGAIQTSKKLLPSLWSAPVPIRVKLEGTVHLLNNLAYPLMLILALILPLAPLVRPRWGVGLTLLIDVPILLAAMGSMIVFYGISQGAQGPGEGKGYRYIPMALALGLGLAVNNTRAVFEAVVGRYSEFVRTPKFAITEKSTSSGKQAYRGSGGSGAWIELLLSFHILVGIGLALFKGRYLVVPFQLLFFVGFFYVGLMSIVGGRTGLLGRDLPRSGSAVRISSLESSP